MRRDPRGALEDIRGAAQYIVDDTTGMTFEEFERDCRTRQLVERNVEIIGEAVNRLHNREPSVAARMSSHNHIVAFRNVLIHGYDIIGYRIVWHAVQESLPIPRAEVEQVWREMEERS